MEFDYYIHSGEVWIYFGENENIVLSFSNVGGAGLSNSAAGVTAAIFTPAAAAFADITRAPTSLRETNVEEQCAAALRKRSEG